MQLIIYCETRKDLEKALDCSISEVILGHKAFSRFGRLGNEEFSQMSQYAKELGLRIIFEWDILMTEKDFLRAVQALKHIDISLIDCWRVQDPGALEYVMNHFAHPVQYICETGNHNLSALQMWKELVGKRLDRLILSVELPKAKLKEYREKLNIPLEILGFGPILLFYTPRSLLTPLIDKKSDEFIEAVGTSEESPHKGFPLIQNSHGTFMFHIKEQCLLDLCHELRLIKLDYLRIDLRQSSMSYLSSIAQLSLNFNERKFEEFKCEYPKSVMKGYFRVNKSDVLFPKLKNYRLRARDNSYVGEVIEVQKDKHLVISIKNKNFSLKNGDTLIIHNTEGKSKTLTVKSLKNSRYQEVEKIENAVAVINFSGGIQPRSQIFI